MSPGRRARGVVVSTEVILILAAVIILALVAMLGLGRMVMSQATATKTTVAVNEAQGWYYGSGDQIRDNSFITVSFYVTNLGDKRVTVTSVEVVAGYFGTAECTYSAGTSNGVNPGETVSIALKLDRISACSSANVNILKQTVIRVSYIDSDGRTGAVEAPIVITKP